MPCDLLELTNSCILQLLAGFQTPYPGAVTPGFSTPSGDLDLTKIGEARKSLVGVKLDQVTALEKF